jgi:hypothetical protein
MLITTTSWAVVQMVVCRQGRCDLYVREGGKECEEERSDDGEVSKEEEGEDEEESGSNKMPGPRP